MTAYACVFCCWWKIRIDQPNCWTKKRLDVKLNSVFNDWWLWASLNIIIEILFSGDFVWLNMEESSLEETTLQWLSCKDNKMPSETIPCFLSWHYYFYFIFLRVKGLWVLITEIREFSGKITSEWSGFWKDAIHVVFLSS